MVMFNKIIFGRLLNVHMVYNDQLFHHFLFGILGKNVTFTPKEFNLLIGLWSADVTIQRDTCGERLQELILEPRLRKEKEKTCSEVEKIFKQFSFTNDRDVVKVALALFIEVVIGWKEQENSIWCGNVSNCRRPRGA